MTRFSRDLTTGGGLGPPYPRRQRSNTPPPKRGGVGSAEENDILSPGHKRAQKKHFSPRNSPRGSPLGSPRDGGQREPRQMPNDEGVFRVEGRGGVQGNGYGNFGNGYGSGFSGGYTSSGNGSYM